MEKAKVTRKDLEIKKGTIEVDFIIVDGKTVNLTPVNYQSIEKYITHEECIDCGTEFAKRFSYDRKCSVCQSLDEIVKYNELPLVEWDGESALALYNDDLYFFDYESIEQYCEEHETEISSLLLVVCERSYFGHIDYEHFADNVHEDWEPSTEMKAKLEEFNKFLDSQSTETWFPSKKRVDLTEFAKEVYNG
ncbi:hypothetical protein [Sphingobacterium sp. BIGb0116]|uniref:hypothetical protein n=1 Tax=Sphingobacterium sp. BIGb0116 TaxID=2940619 RepID=UPI0021698BBD|nr:hypothetical protein [Sphingobacterium sp. BIGb0116]MCS4164421.1 Zn ribbon nucleic-acid-binding protein [Sphingobacterium sp. BIGb0116]